MISAFAAIATTILIALPSVPLFIYVVGLLLPEKHNASHSAVYANTTVDNVWEILSNVEQYSTWQPTLDRKKCTKEEKNGVIIYTERTKRNKYISTVVSTESTPHHVLQRKIEDDSSSMAQRQRHQKPTYIGTWTFTVESEGDSSVKVTITEDGIITRPMVRLLHVALLGFQRHIERFLRDLGKKIQEDAATIKDEVKDSSTPLPSPSQEENNSTEQKDEPVQAVEVDPAAIEGESSTAEKDWDLMSEIYHRPNSHA
ncbi:hypothetical protein BX666DRAFT_2028117 [Dichotomocladium elegans]|nr:hypothetical protein BX666DRAFT_2028117 [Dichotomocladium elegans]